MSLVEQVSLLFRNVQQPIAAIQLYAPIAWSKCHKSSSPSSWPVAFPATLYSHYQQRHNTVSKLCDLILQTLSQQSLSSDVFAAAFGGAQQPLPHPPSLSSSSMLSVDSDDFPPSPIDYSSVLGKDSKITSPHTLRADQLLQGLFIYDSIQARLPSTNTACSTHPSQKCSDATDLAAILPPLLQGFSIRDMLRLLTAIRALHQALRVHLSAVLNDDEDASTKHDTSAVADDEDVFDPTGDIRVEAVSPKSSPKLRRYSTTDDFKIDGWLRLGATSLLAAFNMCNDAAETRNQRGDKELAAQEREMVRECLMYFVDAGSSCSPGVGTYHQTKESKDETKDDATVVIESVSPEYTLADHRSTWERTIESCIRQKTLGKGKVKSNA